VKIAVCAANYVGLELSSFMCGFDHPVEFAITCKGDKKEYEIYEEFRKSNIPCIRNVDINSEKFFNILKKENVDIVFLLWWPKIVKEKIINMAKIGFVNLHPSLLPYNRGKHPYYWSIVENTPAGVSIHFINEKIDEGEIISQKIIETDITTTGETLYKNSIEEIIKLFKETYPKIIENNFNTKTVESSNGTFHLSKQIKSHSEINLESLYPAGELIDIMRARSFTGKKSSFFYLDNKRYNINIQITEDTS
jgi:methionyl-tRNA formyltransferase